MFLSVFYAAATWVQSRRLADLHKNIQEFSNQNGSVVFYKVPEVINSDAEGKEVTQYKFPSAP